MEYWDLYNYEGKKLNKSAIRGSKLNNDEFHIVINAWIINDSNEYLITQRAKNRSHPLMWECTGGSALKGEKPIDAAIREVKEELGIDVSNSSYELIGTTRRLYKNCPDILYVYLFKNNTNINDVKIQEEEVNDVMWASKDKVLELFNEGKFEANSFFNKVIKDNKKIYYVGFNANNAICNESFINGSLTINPNNEIGNIYYTMDYIKERNSEFMDNYKEFLINNMNKLNKDALFLVFNKKVSSLLNGTNFNMIGEDNYELINNLNNKLFTRDLFKNIVPVINTKWINKDITYNEAKKITNSDLMVIQGKSGSGGNDTFFIDCEEKFNKYSSECNNNYFLSSYIKHLPVNITYIVGKYDKVKLPISVQLIKLSDDKFKYVGADFIYTSKLSNEVIDKINDYSEKIVNKLSSIGYKGILGIDYIIDENDNVYFMELNARYQSSSFIISKYLDKYCSTSIAELHYLAITNKYLGNTYIDKIDYSFLNCYKSSDYKDYKYYKRINNGYYKNNKDSYFRKLYDYSIIKHSNFEHRDIDK